jgi:hypothetical protein
MAEHAHHGHHEVTAAEGNDYAQHEGMYLDFLRLVKWSIVCVIIVLVFLWFFVY